MYQALYRKWRPQTFADVVGQSAVTDTLMRQVETGHTSHAYLFSGSRGTGKTTCAKILAKAINCEEPFLGNPCNKCKSCLGISSGEILDVVEIDAASNNGVDGVRDLRDEAIYSPASVKKRVYIIDEVHMFSQSAFNALLKIMEEPPEHVVFILATTELHKVPATIASRCQRFIFKRIPQSAIAKRLMFVAESEGVTLSEEAARHIASLSDGAMRDALSLLDQCMSLGGGNVTAETVEGAVGLAGREQTFKMTEAIANRDLGAALTFLNDIYLSGKNLTSVFNELSDIFRDALILKAAAGKDIPRLSARYTEDELLPIAEKFDSMRLVSAIECLQNTNSAIAASANKRIDAEMCCVRLCEGADEKTAEMLASRVKALEERIKFGAVAVQPQKSAEVKKAPEIKPREKKPEEAPKQSADLPAAKKQPEVQPEKPADTAASGDAKAIWRQISDEAKKVLSPGICPFLSSVVPSFENGVLSITHNNAFALSMISNQDNINIIRDAASRVCSGITVTTAKPEPKKPETSGLDALLAEIGDKTEVTIKE